MIKIDMEPSTAVGSFLAVLLGGILVLWRLLVLLPGPRSRFFTREPNTDAHLMILLGSGGHTGEMLRLLKGIKAENYPRRTWVHYPEDGLSARRALEFDETLATNTPEDANTAKGSTAPGGTEGPAPALVQVKRARSVGQGWISSIGTTISSLVSCFHVATLNPDVLVCNGPGTCVTLCGAVFILKFFGLSHTRIVFIESLARVHGLSLSGKLILPIADRFLVQWPSVASKYRRAEYYGLLV